MSPTVLPSGDQHEIRFGDQRAVAVGVGGGLRVYERAGRPILDGYGPDQRCDGGRGQPLMPWPNRVRDGRYEFDATPQQLPLTEVEKQNAIHGLVRWANWEAAERSPERVVMTHRLHPQPGWATTLDLRLEYSLNEAGLTVTTTAVNAGPSPCPFGAGFHPYLSLGAPAVDALRLRAPAGRYLENDDRGLPVAVHDVEGTELDYREPREIGSAQLDTCFADLVRDDDGLARVEVAAAEAQATLWMDQAFNYVMVFTGDTLAPDRRRQGLAVEPMSCPPDALRSGQDLVRLEPGAEFTARWGISSPT